MENEAVNQSIILFKYLTEISSLYTQRRNLQYQYIWY